jgi:hypothetical protein
MDYFVLACEILFVCFTAYYTIEEVLEVNINLFEYKKENYFYLD